MRKKPEPNSRLTARDIDVREAIVRNEGIASAAARELGMSLGQIYGVLASHKNGAWWQSTKEAWQEKRRKARRHRAYENVKKKRADLAARAYLDSLVDKSSQG